MLLWERLDTSTKKNATDRSNLITPSTPVARTRRLPFDKRCAARTKDGPRCKGRIFKNSEFCFFHDPETIEKRRHTLPSKVALKRRRLKHLPDGYLRKLTTLSAVGEAMDRLYREIRQGVITVEMGEVMFNILTRLQDSGLVTTGKKPERSKAARLRPTMKKLLTRREKIDWNRAVDEAMTRGKKSAPKKKRHLSLDPTDSNSSTSKDPADDTAFRLKLQAVS